MSEDRNVILELVGAAVLFLATVIGGNLLNGWVLSVLWGWFAVPTFHLPSLGVVPAIGVAIIVKYLTANTADVEPPKRSQSERYAYSIGRVFFAPLVSLAFGWIVHLFMATS